MEYISTTINYAQYQIVQNNNPQPYYIVYKYFIPKPQPSFYQDIKTVTKRHDLHVICASTLHKNNSKKHCIYHKLLFLNTQTPENHEVHILLFRCVVVIFQRASRNVFLTMKKKKVCILYPLREKGYGPGKTNSHLVSFYF